MRITQKSISDEYIKFKWAIFDGQLYTLKHEYIHILYQMYKRYLKITIEQFVSNKNNDKKKSIGKDQTDQAQQESKRIFNIRQEKHKEEYQKVFQNPDFYFCPKYKDEMNYLSNVFKSPFTFSSLQQDEQFMLLLQKDYQIVLSQYAYDVLKTYVQQNNLNEIQKMFFNKERSNLIVSKSLLTESYVKQYCINDSENIHQLEKINQSNYILGMLRDNYNYLFKLEEILLKKHNKNEKGIEVHLPHKYPIEKSSQTFLSNCPDYKNKFYYDLAKNYLSRKVIKKDSLTNVLKIGIHDPESQINLVTFNRDLKFILLATCSGLIIGYQLFEDSQKSQQEEYSKDKRDVVLGQQSISYFDSNLKDQDFKLKTNKYSYIGHSNVVTCMDISFNSSYFISGSADSQIRLWNILSGNCLAIYKGHIKTLWHVKICPRGYYFLSACSDSLIFLWSTNTSKPLKRFIGHTQEITCMEFTKNMIYFVTASYDLTIRIWNIDDKQLVRVLYVDSPVMCFDINEVGQILITGDQQGNIIVWETNKAIILKKFKFKDGINKVQRMIRGINLSFDEHYILIYNASTFAYYDFSPFKQEISKDVFNEDKRCPYEIDPIKEDQ